MATPYITPQQLVLTPLGIDWDSIPGPDANQNAINAALTQLCWQATYEADDICQQTLRATINTESFYGPDPGDVNGRCYVMPNGVVRFTVPRFPVLAVTGGQVSPATAFPESWTAIPVSKFRVPGSLFSQIGSSVPGPGGTGLNEIHMSPGYVDNSAGRAGYYVQVTYVNGWPHASLTASCVAGATTVSVDDVTGFAIGGANTVCRILDGAETETVVVDFAGSAGPTGAGTLTLVGGTQYAHSDGCAISTLPDSVTWATALLAACAAVERGLVSLDVQAFPGSSHGGSDPLAMMKAEAMVFLHPYTRVV